MKKSIFITLLLIAFISVTARAQSKHAPFTINAAQTAATLKIKGTPLVKKYAAVFKKHRLNAASTIDWKAVVEQITGLKETDLYLSGALHFEEDESKVEVSSKSPKSLQQMLGAVCPILESTQKLDAFLKEQEQLLKKG
jgi:hypothetical protein